MKTLPKAVLIREVGPRDGLQNEAKSLSPAEKIDFIQGLIHAGASYIEATAFVSPKAIPQLQDADQLAAMLPTRDSVTFSALVPNEKGMERAMKAGFREVAVFTAASETFNQKNIHCSIQESFDRFRPVFKEAQRNKIRVRGYVSTAFFCPFEGEISVTQTAHVTKRLFDEGVYEVSIGDTIGKASPMHTIKLFETLLKTHGVESLAGHFHDTYGMALANVIAALNLGIHIFDSSAGGLGGCPYAPGASGNLATEDLVFALQQLQVTSSYDLKKLVGVSSQMEKLLGRKLPSKVLRAFIP